MRIMTLKILGISFMVVFLVFIIANTSYATDEQTKKVLKQGLLGAGVGAISAGASGGKAGQGALIGAGTSVLGSALLDAVTGPPARKSAPPDDYRDDDYYYDEDLDEYYYEEPAPRQESGTQKILKQGLLGAGVGAISASASGGKAGKGALIGAGTSVIGSALLDTITEPAPSRRGRTYRRVPSKRRRSSSEEEGEPTHKKVIKKYDESGKLVSEEEIYY